MHSSKLSLRIRHCRHRRCLSCTNHPCLQAMLRIIPKKPLSSSPFFQALALKTTERDGGKTLFACESKVKREFGVGVNCVSDTTPAMRVWKFPLYTFSSPMDQQLRPVQMRSRI